MPVCPRCGHGHREGSRFCNACVEPLTLEVVASGDAMRAALRRDMTDTAVADFAVDPDRGPAGDGPYVRSDGFPWSPVDTLEQSYGQFLLFTVIAVLAMVFVFAAFVSAD